MQHLQQQQVHLVEAVVRHKHKAAEQEERAIATGKSRTQLRMCLTHTAKELEVKVLDEKSSDSADEETKKAYQDALKIGTGCSQASGRNCGAGADNGD